MTHRPTISTLTLWHTLPDHWAADPWAEVRPLVDGRDVLREVHPEGQAPSCWFWRGPADSWPLAATEEPRRIMIAEPICTAGCCGALYVTVRREGPHVIWDAWENTSDIHALPAAVRFDAAQYDAELTRAAADRSWEEPVDTTARLLLDILVDSRWFERWDCDLTSVWPRRAETGVPEEIADTEGVTVEFRRSGGSDDEPTDRYRYELLTEPGQSAQAEARRLADLVLADDPRKTAELQEF